MRRMIVGVENVLRGDISNERVDIYYFTWAGGFDGPQPLGMWRIGSRRIFWLRRDRGVLRTACDGGDGCTWGVYGGNHPRLTVNPADSIDRAVAEIVLSRGQGLITEARFAGAILRGAPVPDEYQIEDFRRLAMTELGVIKTAACEALWITGHDPRFHGISQQDMTQAHCGCPVVSGELDCGSRSHVQDDPPY
jgi:hypothetical protein